jgi:hypothetical protein
VLIIRRINCINTISVICQSMSVTVKYTGKNCVSSWSFTKDHNEMHGQENIKFSEVLMTAETTVMCSVLEVFISVI